MRYAVKRGVKRTVPILTRIACLVIPAEQKDAVICSGRDDK
ncbi:Uncharacterised protein [Mycobacteroides abscessus subsp. abscessus]|nr:Uncharacterised protein [Mycobacteroides abscessus subsp. abscessus]